MEEKILAKFIMNYDLDCIISEALEKYYEEGGFSLSIKDDPGAWAEVSVEVKELEYASGARDEVVLDFEYFETDGADEEKDLKIEIFSSAAYMISCILLDE